MHTRHVRERARSVKFSMHGDDLNVVRIHSIQEMKS